MVKIAFFNKKGGVGKTTSVVNLAATLDNMNKKVLVVDCDSQNTATNYLLTYTKHQYTIEDLFDDVYYDMSIDKVIAPVMLRHSLMKTTTEKSHISVLPASKNIETLPMDNIYQIRDLLHKVEDKYDYCLFDLPPHLSGISLCALVASDYVIVPARADTDSLSGYDDLMDTVTNIRNKGYNVKLSVLGVMFNDINGRRMIQKHIHESSMADMKDSVFKTYIRSSSSVEQARFMGVPLPSVKLDRNTADDYKNLAKEIIKKIKETENLNA